MDEEPERLYECRVGRIQADVTTFWMLSRMSWVGTKLYNTALWYSREVWQKTGKIPSKYDLQKVVNESWFHDFLPAHTYQNQAHRVRLAYQGWFVLRKKDKTANPPRFRKKEILSTIMFTQYGFKYRDNKVQLTIGPKMREEFKYPNKFLSLNVAWNTPLPEKFEMQQVEIVSKKGFFEVHAKLKLPEPEWKQTGQVVAIDLGMRNPIAAAFENGREDIFKGGEVLSELHYLNKTKHDLQHEIMKRTKGKKKGSKALSTFGARINAQKDHAIHAMTTQFINICVKEDVKEVVVGDLGGIKKNNDGTGKKWNDKSSQNWQQFPVQTLVQHLRYKLARHGIFLAKQDERWTSKGRCSVCGCTDRSLIRRVKRGMFYCGNCDSWINADQNGSRNQLARYLHREVPIDIGTSTGSSGCLAQPSVWRWDHHQWMVVS